MKFKSKQIIRHIGDNLEGIGKIELIIETVRRIADDVPAVVYKVFDSAEQEKINSHVTCSGYLRLGKWIAKSVANEVWAYYQSRGINTSVIDKLTQRNNCLC